MVGEADVTVCILCEVLLGNPRAPIRSYLSEREVPTEILATSKHFALIADVAPIVSGYLLLVSLAHARSLSALSSEAIDEYEEIERYLLEALPTRFGRAFALEHGGAENAHSAPEFGQCIDHAHVHFVPLSVSPMDAATETYDFARIAELPTSQLDYLSFSDGVDRRVAYESAPPRQFWRRVIADTAGGDGPWNWREYLHPPWSPLARQRVIEVRDWVIAHGDLGPLVLTTAGHDTRG